MVTGCFRNVKEYVTFTRYFKISVDALVDILMMKFSMDSKDQKTDFSQYTRVHLYFTGRQVTKQSSSKATLTT